MKTTESTGLPTILSSGNGQKLNSGFIELTMKANGRRVLFPLAHISMVTEGERAGCDVYYMASEYYVEVCESYDEVKRLMEEVRT